jgi:hypothetical protein
MKPCDPSVLEHTNIDQKRQVHLLERSWGVPFMENQI